jgi:hypothetical protein
MCVLYGRMDQVSTPDAIWDLLSNLLYLAENRIVGNVALVTVVHISGGTKSVDHFVVVRANKDPFETAVLYGVDHTSFVEPTESILDPNTITSRENLIHFLLRYLINLLR